MADDLKILELRRLSSAQLQAKTGENVQALPSVDAGACDIELFAR